MLIECLPIPTGGRLGEISENPAIRNAAVTRRIVVDDAEIQFVGGAALTERVGMPGRSVEALVDGRDARRDEFDLVMVEREFLALPHVIGRLERIEEERERAGHESERAGDVGRRARQPALGEGNQAPTSTTSSLF